MGSTLCPDTRPKYLVKPSKDFLDKTSLSSTAYRICTKDSTAYPFNFTHSYLCPTQCSTS